MPPTDRPIGSPAFPQLRFVDQQSWWEKRDISFRYDQAVLIVGATWHQKKVAYAESLYLGLMQVYTGHEGDVRAGAAEALSPSLIPPIGHAGER